MSAHRASRSHRPGARRTFTAAVLAASAGLGLLVTALPASAAGPWFVAPATASPAGNNANNCLSAAAPCATVTGVLAKAGFADGDTINVAAGTYADRPVFGAKTATVNGAGASTVFTGSATAYAIGVNMATSKTLTLNNLVLTNGRGFNNVGGALTIVAGKVVTNNVSMTNSSVTNQGGAAYVPAAPSSLTMTGGTISGNTAPNGGAIYTVGGPVVLNGTTVSGNTGTLGGALYAAGGAITMNGGSLSGNTAPNGGAAFNFGTLTLDGTTVNGNTANGAALANAGNGGAVYNSAALVVKNASMSGNKVVLSTNASPGVSGYGGTIFSANLAANAPTVSLTNTQIAGGGVSGGNAFVGGALASYQTTVGGTTTAITGSGLTLSGNVAAAAGGVYSTGALTLTDSTLTANKATHASAGNGGALYLITAAPVVVDNTDVTSNTATTSAGGIYNAGAPLEIRNGSTVNGNSAPVGGGITNGGPLTVRSSEVSGNQASNSGAGLYTGANTTLVDTKVDNNTAAFLGGGIAQVGGTLTATGGHLNGNTAYGAGGLIVGNALPASFDGTDFQDNTSTGANFGGGAILSAGQVSIRNATLSGNKADGSSGSGGAVFSGTDDDNVATSLRIESSLLTDNEAFQGSAVLARSTGTGGTNKTSILNSTVTGNASSSTAGALQLFHPSSITGSTITDNTAVGSGNVGGIVAFANTIALSGSIIAGNTGTQCFAAVVDGGYNLVTPGNTVCGLSAARNDVFAAPQLGALAANGGPTRTQLPSASSPALDRIPAATGTGVTDGVTGAAVVLCTGTDQRGTSRPQGAKCDIGAVEKEQTVPTVAGPAAATYTVGAAGAPLTYTSTGSPQATLSATGLPSGVTLTDNGDGTATISGTPAAGTGGVHNVTVKATNEAGTGTTSLTLTVNQAPALSGPSAATYTVGQPGGPSTFTSTGFPTSVLTSLGLLPGGVTFTDNGDGTGAYAGTPASGSGGLYHLNVKAANGTSPDATTPFDLTVHEAPGITGPSTATFTVGATGTSAAFSASGFPVPTFSGAGLPSGLSVVGTGAGTAAITGNPADGTGGVHPVTVTAANGVGSNATKSVSVTVNEAPELVGPSVVRFVAGVGGTFGYSSDGFPQASFTKTGALPLGLTFVDNGNGSAKITGTASALVVGTYNIVIRAGNGVDPDATLAVQVQVVPQLAIATTSLPNAGYRTMYSAQLNATGGQPAYTWDIASGSLPAGLSLSPTGLITGATTANPGTYNVTVRVTDTAAEPQVRTKALSITVVKGVTTLQPEGIVVTFPDNGDVNVNLGIVEATLKGGFPQVPVAGATVSFKSGTLALCSAVTNASGFARCTPNTLVWLLVPVNGKVTASYAGSTVWAASTGTAGVIR